MKPVVSIIVAVHNMRKHICECIDSVLTQSLRDIELILVDDVSTDGTAQIIKEYELKDSRVKILWQKENGGAQLARNAGIAVSNGDYIFVLDHDDILAPDTLELAVAEFNKNTDIHCVCLREIRLRDDGSTYEHKERNSFGVISGEEAFFRSIGWKGITARMLVTRDLQLAIPFDNCERVYGEDNTAQLQFLASPMVASCQGIYYHRILSTSLSHCFGMNNIRRPKRLSFLGKELKNRGYSIEIRQANETEYWLEIIDAYFYYYKNKKLLSEEERKAALREIREYHSLVEWNLVSAQAKGKLGYRRMPTWQLFVIQEEIYFGLRRLLSI